MVFLDRSKTGRQLAGRLAGLRLADPIVILISTGGVRVGWEIAKRLEVPMDVLLPRVVTVPGSSQIPIGVVADGKFYPDRTAIWEHQVPLDYAERMGVLEAQMERVQEEDYRGGAPRLDVANRTAIVVDDGSRGAQAAYCTVDALHRHGAEEVIYAAPCCSPGVSARIGHDAKLMTLYPPDEFRSVFISDKNFQQTTVKEIVQSIGLSREFGQDEVDLPSVAPNQPFSPSSRVPGESSRREMVEV